MCWVEPGQDFWRWGGALGLESVDTEQARSTYLEALSAGIFAGQLASPGSGLWEVARAALTAPQPPGPARAPDLPLDGLAAYYTDGYAAGVPVLRQALTAFGADMRSRQR